MKGTGREMDQGQAFQLTTAMLEFRSQTAFSQSWEYDILGWGGSKRGNVHFEVLEAA